MADDVPTGFTERLKKVFELAGSKLGPEAQAQLAELATPQALLVVAGVLVAWIVGHAFGIGELVDIVLAVVGWFSIGMAVFSGLDELFAFAGKRTRKAATSIAPQPISPRRLTFSTSRL